MEEGHDRDSNNDNTSRVYFDLFILRGEGAAMVDRLVHFYVLIPTCLTHFEDFSESTLKYNNI